MDLSEVIDKITHALGDDILLSQVEDFVLDELNPDKVATHKFDGDRYSIEWLEASDNSDALLRLVDELRRCLT